MNHLQAEINRLNSLRDRIHADGAAAQCEMWIDVYRPGGRDVDYARLKAAKPVFNGKKQRGLGRVGSADHQEWKLKIKRRNALAEIERRVLQLQEMMAAPQIWEPELADDDEPKEA